MSEESTSAHWKKEDVQQLFRYAIGKELEPSAENMVTVLLNMTPEDRREFIKHY